MYNTTLDQTQTPLFSASNKNKNLIAKLTIAQQYYTSIVWCCLSIGLVMQKSTYFVSSVEAYTQDLFQFSNIIPVPIYIVYIKTRMILKISDICDALRQGFF